MKKVTKAIIPAAGLGTRFLPQTKAMPKEMLPIIDKPIIQYVVEEAVAAGVTDIIIVTGSHKRSIEDHFDHQYQLEEKLMNDGKEEIAHQLSDIAELANFIYLRQKGQPGSGTPILNAAHLLDDDEPFLVMWADDFFKSNVPVAKQLVEEYEKLQQPVIAMIEVDDEGTKRYGIPVIKSQVREDLIEIGGFMEKPGPEKAPSHYAGVGRYVVTPDIIPLIENQELQDGELFFATALAELSAKSPVYGKLIKGKYHDTGNKEKYLEALVDVALDHPELGPGFRTYLKNRIAE